MLEPHLFCNYYNIDAHMFYGISCGVLFDALQASSVHNSLHSRAPTGLKWHRVAVVRTIALRWIHKCQNSIRSMRPPLVMPGWIPTSLIVRLDAYLSALEVCLFQAIVNAHVNSLYVKWKTFLCPSCLSDSVHTYLLLWRHKCVCRWCNCYIIDRMWLMYD